MRLITLKKLQRCAEIKGAKVIYKLMLVTFLFQVGNLNVFAAKAKYDEIKFPNVPDIEYPENVNFSGFYDQSKDIKIVFGVSDPKTQLKETLVNAAYTIKYLKPRKIKSKLHIVLYAKGVAAANQFSELFGGYAPLIEELQKHGVEFTVCYNSMVSLKIPEPHKITFGTKSIAKARNFSANG